MKNKLLCTVALIIIIAGTIVYQFKGFNKELNYSNRQQFEISAASTFDVSKVENIAKEVLANKKVKVQKVERFNNALEIISTEISEDDKRNIINKVNEEYNETISNEDISIISVPETRVRDIFRPYIIPGILILSAVLIYYISVYHKIGLNRVLILGTFLPIMVELLYYKSIVIIRIPFGRITNGIAVGVYILTLVLLTMYFQNEMQKLDIVKEKMNEKENDK